MAVTVDLTLDPVGRKRARTSFRTAVAPDTSPSVAVAKLAAYVAQRECRRKTFRLRDYPATKNFRPIELGRKVGIHGRCRRNSQDLWIGVSRDLLITAL